MVVGQAGGVGGRLLKARCALFSLALLLSLAGCDWARKLNSLEPTQILYKRDQLTLSWDPPVTDIQGFPSEVEAYLVYYQEYGSNYWRLLDEVKASRQPQYTIHHDRLGDGEFDFAIRARSVNGKISSLHTSLDADADPISGWYVFWVQSR